MPHQTIPERGPTGPLRITEQELRAYAEGTLAPEHHARIAGYLACNPDLAARVMQTMHLRGRVQELHAATPGPHPRRTRLIATCVACAFAGWAFAVGLDEDGPLQGLLVAPEYVEDAVMSWTATHLRLGMQSQMQTPRMDTEELLHALQIRLPPLPAEWQLLDAQVYPSEAGPGISVLMELAPGRRLNLFAVRSDTAASANPAVTSRSGRPAAYWEVDGAAYVLTGDGSREEILAQARHLSKSGLL